MNQTNQTNNRLRVCIHRSNKYITAQIIDDSKSSTIVSVEENETKSVTNKSDQAILAAQILAKKALDKNISYVRFDRRSYRYQGRVSKFADELRKHGLQF